MRAIALALALSAVVAGPGAAQATPARATITYISGGVAYLDAGREEGLAVGMETFVVRSGARTVTLIVTDLASHRAACRIPEGAAALVAVGDTVEYLPNRPAATSTAPRSAGAAARTSASPPGIRLRGRIGVRYLMLAPAEGEGGFSQPALDLRLDLSQPGGTGFGMTMDVRARQSYVTRADGTTTRDTRTAVYQAALLLRSPNHPWRVAVGRQYLAPVSSLSLFDGLLVEAQGRQFGVGIFGGSEPDQGSMGYSSDIRDYGAFLELRSPPGGSARWSIATGGVGSYQAGEVNREFVFAQASLSTPGLTIFAAQEADLNRGWKQEAGEPAFALTSSFVSVNARPTQALAVNAGLDTRRRVRLYRDRANPEQSFDDSFRQGVWTGASVRAGPHLRLGLDGRAALGGPDSTAHSHSTTGSLALERLTTQQFSVRSRYTRYGTSRGNGWLGTVSAGVRPGQALGIELNGGRRSEVATLDLARRQTTWVGADLDVAVGRAMYLLLSGSRERGDGAAGDQVLVSVSVRF
ncbi:MAG: hypothetical protein KJZ47_03190 [Gemmatimonadales bacterium]|nr:hypothetical protein [Gemmatimonadales bacterium]